MMDVLPLLAAEPAPNAAVLLAIVLLLVGGVVGAMLGHWVAEQED